MYKFGLIRGVNEFPMNYEKTRLLPFQLKIFATSKISRAGREEYPRIRNGLYVELMWRKVEKEKNQE